MENLSEKTIKCVCGGDDDNRRILYHEKDVKEFIHKLYEVVDGFNDLELPEQTWIKLSKEIKELAGKKLI